MSDDRLEMILEWSFGFLLLLLYTWLSHAIAIGKVQEDTSFGLPIIMNSLSALGGAWGVLIVSRAKDRKNAKANGSEKVGPS